MLKILQNNETGNNKKSNMKQKSMAQKIRQCNADMHISWKLKIFRPCFLFKKVELKFKLKDIFWKNLKEEQY
jgi:hypothetical protein